jgi:hypothetical protein
MQKQTVNTNVNVLEAGDDPASVESVAVEMVTYKLSTHSFDAANFQHLSDMCYSMFLPVITLKDYLEYLHTSSLPCRL